MENEVVTILPRTEDLVFWLGCLVTVIVLPLWDVWKAWKRRAPWIPVQAPSVLIIQLLYFVDYAHVSVYSGMARPGSVMVWGSLTAVAWRVTFHVVSEVQSVWNVEKRNEWLSALAASFDLCSTILILTVMYLLWLLMKAVMSGRTICRITSPKIHSALSCCCTPCDRPSYNETKDGVLNCWLVARLYQLDYVLVRTVLYSRAFTVVTVCIGVHVINHRSLSTHTDSVTRRTLVQFVIVGQCVIILIVWIVLLLRWVTSHMQGDIFRGDYFKRSIEDAQHDLITYLMSFFVRDRRIQEKRIRALNEKCHYINSLFSLFFQWQKLFQIFSMQNPEMFSRIKTRVIAYVKSRAVVDRDQYSKYKWTLKMLLIPGESAWRLWIINQWGFRKVERCIDQGQEDGKRSCCELIFLLKLVTVTAEGEAGISFEELRAKVMKANKNSWKRTVVSLIRLMIYFSYGSDDSVRTENAMQCRIQLWEFMNLVDGLNEEVQSLGRQADKEFDSLQHSWHKRAQFERHQLESRSNEERRNLQNFRDWTEVAISCLLKTWMVLKMCTVGINMHSWHKRAQFEELEGHPLETLKVIDPHLSACQNTIQLLQRVLAEVCSVYMTEYVNKAVLQKCRKLAEEGQEEEILHVAFVSGKAQGVLDKVREGNDPEDPVEPRHNTDQASTSSTIPTVNEQVGEGNDQAELPHNTDQGSISSPIQTEIELVVKGNDPKEPGEFRHST